jgi:NADH-quinone oxidoreductase subunit J
MSTSEQVLFWIVAPIVVAGALALLVSKRAVVIACSIVLTMVGLAFLYVGMNAPFLGVVQVVVYTGAIMMLFVFVLMLVGVDISDSFVETIRGQRWIGAVGGLGLLAVLVGAVTSATLPDGPVEKAVGEPRAVAEYLFSNYPFTLEITGTLLIVAAMGAVVLTHKTRLAKSVSQTERSIKRFRDGGQLTPYAAPGVYARHNAADIPAVDASGRPIETSVPSVVRMRGQTRRLRGVAQDLLPAEVDTARQEAPATPEEPPAEPKETTP